MDIKKILVPIDGSDASERAFSYAVAFAKKTAAELILLYVVDADVLMYPVYRVSLAETDTASVKKKYPSFSPETDSPGRPEPDPGSRHVGPL